MLLGIGTSGPQVAEGWHGQRFGKQLQRTREYIAVVRMALARERVVFKGETLELPLPDGPGKALKLTIAPVQERMPIYLAAIGPKNTTLGAEIADGWIPTLFSPEHVGEFRPLLEEGFARAGGGKGVRRLRHRPDRQRERDRRPRRGARRDAPVRRALRRRDGLAQAELLQRARPAATGSRTPPARSRTSTSRASARRRWRRCPPSCIDKVSLCGPPDVVRERLAIFRDAGVGTLMVSPMAWSLGRRLEQLRLVAELAPERREDLPRRLRRSGPRLPDDRARRHAGRARPRRRAGHVAEVARAGRGGRHDVRAAPEYQVFPTREKPLKPYAAAVRAAQRDPRRSCDDFAPDVAVADILTPAPALAAELEGVPLATLVPHVFPFVPPGPSGLLDRRAPPAHGARRGAVGAREPALRRPVARAGPRASTTRRRRAPRARPAAVGPHRALAGADDGRDAAAPRVPAALVERWVRVVGPLQWEPPGERVEPPPGRGPVVLVAPSTSQDPEHAAPARRAGRASPTRPCA